MSNFIAANLILKRQTNDLLYYVLLELLKLHISTLENASTYKSLGTSPLDLNKSWRICQQNLNNIL